MSRSRRKTPIVGITTATSEKKDKQAWHRSLRRQATSRLNKAFRDAELDQPEVIEAIQEVTPVENEVNEITVSNPWGMSKDGRQWCGDYLNDPDGSPEERAARQRRILNK